MGCDIHAHFEVKVRGRWLYYGEGKFSRDYFMFAHLAGVRNSFGVTPVAEHRGIPTDATEMTLLQKESEGGDDHSHSWVSSEEYAEVCRRMAEDGDKNGYRPDLDGTWLFGNSFYDFHTRRSWFPDFVEDFRMVFWFDN